MGRIVAIGGGELPNTKKLNEYAIKLSGKVKPNFLFIGTASHDAPGYIENIQAAFELLNCVVRALKLTDESCSADEIDTLGIALENQTAFVENNGEKYIIRENNDVKAYFLQYKNGQLEKTEMGEKYGYKNKIS